MTEDLPDLGPCCGCGTHKRVVNIIMLPYKAPEPSKGWGCIVCGLPNDGAIAVFCDGCLGADHRAERVEHDVCAGYPREGRRVPFAEVERLGAHEHDAAKHEREDGHG